MTTINHKNVQDCQVFFCHNNTIHSSYKPGNERIIDTTMGKRANGEGTVYQRKDGRWVASIVLENGTRKSIYCKTQQEAIKKARQTNQAKDQGILLAGADQTVHVIASSCTVFARLKQNRL